MAAPTVRLTLEAGVALDITSYLTSIGEHLAVWTPLADCYINATTGADGGGTDGKLLDANEMARVLIDPDDAGTPALYARSATGGNLYVRSGGPTKLIQYLADVLTPVSVVAPITETTAIAGVEVTDIAIPDDCLWFDMRVSGVTSDTADRVEFYLQREEDDADVTFDHGTVNATSATNAVTTGAASSRLGVIPALTSAGTGVMNITMRNPRSATVKTVSTSRAYNPVGNETFFNDVLATVAQDDNTVSIRAVGGGSKLLTGTVQVTWYFS